MIYVRIGENQNEAFAKVNPFKVLPTIEEDGYMLFESAAILTYVAEKYNLPDHWYPKPKPVSYTHLTLPTNREV